MLKTLRIAGRDRKRLEEIFSVTSRYGLGVLLARIGLDRSGSDDAGDGVSHSLPRRTARSALTSRGKPGGAYTYEKLSFRRPASR